MNGRLRLDTMVTLVEAFLRNALMDASNMIVEQDGAQSLSKHNRSSSMRSVPSSVEVSGPLYIAETGSHSNRLSFLTQEQEIRSGVPLSEVLATRSQGNLADFTFPPLRKLQSLPSGIPVADAFHPGLTFPPLRKLHSLSGAIPVTDTLSDQVEHNEETQQEEQSKLVATSRERRPLVNRPGLSDLDRPTDSFDDLSALDFVSVPVLDASAGAPAETRDIPLIPFHELMLIETIGTGRVSTIYRAAWQRGNFVQSHLADTAAVRMVALKVATVNAKTGDTAHIDELRREADIAARLAHPNICHLIGVAADPECFCLAYEYCEGGSLLSLLSDSSRYYEYLPIALDIVRGMAFLHKSSIIHRDLKPSNILLTRDHRAKIADFGMSVNNHGQELTAETGTYRYMAPEVIRHDAYGSNADVYSFGVCLWQLITREIPFATMTPIQAAYAVAEGHRPEIPSFTPRKLHEVIRSCWDQDSHRRPSFTYIAMALAGYAKMAFSPASVGTLTLQIANEMLATIEGNSTVNVDFSTPVAPTSHPPPPLNYFSPDLSRRDSYSNLGLEIE
jgi:serine/threonine protein kinase